MCGPVITTSSGSSKLLRETTAYVGWRVFGWLPSAVQHVQAALLLIVMTAANSASCMRIGPGCGMQLDMSCAHC
jgi:hypothetical protein